MMKMSVGITNDDTIVTLREKLWPIFKTLESDQRITNVSKPENLLMSIQDRVLILHFVKPSLGGEQQNSAWTLSYFGSEFFHFRYSSLKRYFKVKVKVLENPTMVIWKLMDLVVLFTKTR